MHNSEYDWQNRPFCTILPELDYIRIDDTKSWVKPSRLNIHQRFQWPTKGDILKYEEEKDDLGLYEKSRN